jgi:hypothetical protein
MFLLGDVLVIVALIVGLCLTQWALIVAFGLLFTRRAETAQQVLLTRPGRTIGLGALIGVPTLLMALALLAQPIPGQKILGTIVLLALLSVAMVGGSGLALVIGERLKEMAPDMPDYAAFSRGAGFLVMGSMLPLLGWFAFWPIALLASIGAGFRALQRPSLAFKAAP